MDLEGRLLLEIGGVRLRRVPRDWLARLVAGPLPDWCYELAWVSQPLTPPPAQSPADESGEWLIFDSCEAIGAALAEKLEKMSQHATVVPAGTDPPSRLTAVRECTSVPERKCRGVIYLGDLDVKDKENGSLGDLEVKDNENVPDFAAARDSGWGGVLDVVHALTQSEGSDAPRLWLVTRGAQAVGDRPMPLSLAQSPVWGLARVIAAEHPTLGCTRIDLDPEDQGNDADQLFEEISSGITAKIRSPIVAANAAWRGCGGCGRANPTVWSCPAANPIGWKSRPAGNWIT